MYRIVCTAIAVGTLSTGAWADTVPDPKAWARQFVAIAAHADKDALFTALISVADPQINPAALESGLESIDRANEGRKAQSASIIREVPLGDAVYRFNMAVHYGSVHYLFYSVDMLHVDDGWEVVYFHVSSDLNNILNMPWPIK